ERVFVGRENMLGLESELFGDAREKRAGDFRRDAAVTGFIVEQRRVLPDGFAIAAPETVQRPARQLFARIPLALPEMRQPLRRVLVLEAVVHLDGEAPLVGTHGGGVPFGAVRIIDRDER